MKKLFVWLAHNLVKTYWALSNCSLCVVEVLSVVDDAMQILDCKRPLCSPPYCFHSSIVARSGCNDPIHKIFITEKNIAAVINQMLFWGICLQDKMTKLDNA